MTPGLGKIPDRTEQQARDEIARKDRQSWFAVHRVTGEFGIMSRHTGFGVAQCDSREYRDLILTMAKSHDAMLAVVEVLAALPYFSDISDEDADLVIYKNAGAAITVRDVRNAKAALALARGQVKA